MRADLKSIHCICFIKNDGTISQFTNTDTDAAKAKWDDWLSRKDTGDADSDSNTAEYLHVAGIWYHAGRVVKQVSIK